MPLLSTSDTTIDITAGVGWLVSADRSDHNRNVVGLVTTAGMGVTWPC